MTVSEKNNVLKSTILFMSITRYGCSQRHDIAFITDEFKFYYFNIKIAQHIRYISHIQHDKIREIFKNFILSDKTNILIQDTIDDFSPLYLYFKIIFPYIEFNMSIASLIKVVKRIYYKHTTISKRVTNKTSNITIKNVNMFLYKAWDYLIKTNECPWITKDIDNQLKLISRNEAKYQKRASICLYYMFVKTKYMLLNKKCAENKNV